MNSDDRQLDLKVAEAQQDDVNKGIVRIDTDLMKDLDLRQGDIAEIEGQKKSVAIIGRAFPSDIGASIIRMDGLTRRNSGTSIGERVKVRKATIRPAKKIIIAPAQKGVVIKGQFEGLVNSLLGRAVVKGDIISLGGTTRRRRAFMGGPFEEIFSQIMSEDFFPGAGFGFLDLKFMVINTNPKDSAVIVTEDTIIEVKSEAIELLTQQQIPEITYEDIGGLEEEIKKVREMIELPLKHPEIFERLGVKPPKGVLLYGPPGTGKTLLARAVAAETKANFVTINGPEIMSKFVGEAEKKLRDIFEEAEKKAPTIIFIDEIDAIAPKRDESYGEVERRVVAQLLALMDGMKGRGKVIVIAATNRANALDPALRRGGRFDREIEIGVPNRSGRLEVLKIHTRSMPVDNTVNLDELADVTHGFVGADIEGLTKEAAMSVLRRIIPDFNLKDKKPTKDFLEKLIVTKDDFKDALKTVRPSAMRELLIETPKINWNDIGGLKNAKEDLIESIEWPLKKPEVFKRLGIRPPRGILLYGPPGTGKTLLAKAVAKESEANFISVKGPELVSKWVGESEKAVREVFKKARQVSPSIIFFDEFDSLAPRRGSEQGAKVGEKVVNQILTEMDGLEELTDVVVIAATNRPELIDPALLRPGRFDRWVLVAPPTDEERLEILKVHLKPVPLEKGINLEEFNKKLKGYSGADIEAVVREAAMAALRESEDAKEVKNKHFNIAIKKITPSLTKDDEENYKQMLDNVKKSPQTIPEYLG